mmetsp:Transcript_59827/g.129629  ORF Transcript_59827/g.129629 Transcript_59827/m.129629 type:complete len:798 (-) Transcript_59827:211-2604(-)
MGMLMMLFLALLGLIVQDAAAAHRKGRIRSTSRRLQVVVVSILETQSVSTEGDEVDEVDEVEEGDMEGSVSESFPGAGKRAFRMTRHSESTQTEEAEEVGDDLLTSWSAVTPQAATAGSGEQDEYECGREPVGTRHGHESRSCDCHGLVRFGYDSYWSQPRQVSGQIDCTASVFGNPYPGRRKVCMCQPAPTQYPTRWSNDGSDCMEGSICNCYGLMRFGFGFNWSAWQQGPAECSVTGFGDPLPGHSKICQCKSMSLGQWALPPPIAASPHASASMASIIAVTFTYFLVSASLASVRSCGWAAELSQGPVEQVLAAVMSRMGCAPMLCAVFFAVTKRAETVTGGDPEHSGLPQPFLEVAIVIAAGAFCIHTVLRIFVEWLMRTGPEQVSSHSTLLLDITPGVDDVAEKRRFLSRLAQWALAVMHVALVVVLIGIVTMKESLPEKKAHSHHEQQPPIAAGTICTLVLAVPYFAAHLLMQVLAGTRSAGLAGAETKLPASSSMAAEEGTSVPGEVAKLAAAAMGLTPMLCVFFLGSQLLAEWSKSIPGGYVEVCMYSCTVAVLVQVVLAVTSPLAAGAELRPSGPRGELALVTRNYRVFLVVGFARWLAMTVLYVGVEVLCCWMWSLEALPITRLLRHLVGFYFTLFLIHWVMTTLKELLNFGNRSIRALRAAKDILAVVPMLAVLFLEAWVRAQHILVGAPEEPGVPQGYSQDSMYLATLALLLQLLFVFLSGVMAPTLVTATHRSNIQKRDGVISLIIALFLHIFTLVLFISAAVVIASMFAISSENATGEGSWLA